MQAYLAAAPAADAESKRADQEKAVALANFLDKAYPTDPSTDAVRMALGQLYARQGRHQLAFDTVAKIGPGYARLAFARLTQGGSAYELVRPKPGDASDLPADKKAALVNRAVAALMAVPEPAAEVDGDSAKLYVLLATQAAQLHLATGKAGFPKAEASAQQALARIPKFTNLQRRTS